MKFPKFSKFSSFGSAVVLVGLWASPPVGAVPLVGGNGLCPNASALAHYIMNTYPNVHSIGGVRADRLPDHPSGHALDIMVDSDMALGDVVAADMRSNQNFGIKYVLWRVPNHFNHVHVTVF